MSRILQLFLILSLASLSTTKSQSFINGDFENNSATGDQINLTNASFNAMMQNCTGFGDQANLDIITSNTYSGGPQNGSWYVGVSGVDEFSMELSSPLTQGSAYSVTFYDKADSSFQTVPIRIGVSMNDTSFGFAVYNPLTGADVGIWNERTFTFTAPISATYITVKSPGPIQSWVQVDNFTIGPGVSIETGMDEYGFVIYPNPAKDLISIDLGDLKSQLSSVSILDMSGKTVINSKKFEKIDISELSVGIYIVQVSVGDRVSRQRFIKE